jgi:transcription elongation factor GreB
VVKALAAAAAEGDRSENAEYHYRKKELAGIDRRIRYLSKRLGELKAVDRLPDDPSKIFFGAWVELEDEQGETLRYRIVGPDEFDMESAYISMDSPMAKALMKKTAGDDVVVSSPAGKLVYAVIDVRYTPFV